ncbi:phosphate-starvation-inducible PsiE family protein [Halobacterium jilantaiense]|uniref:Uncharacterized membrane protein, DUF373 family n=1 Tax=Halobacterium jilantaiense TaxID=355548 RepID=A0A1I0PGG4_9EURY|nr:phosphate-starvation-inducible PsiE family protein [Halobacterium jilantaiense]SEW13543.1 Uncharacterized membrane protein, DUF373 family [Halobacterium jilantaiense]
MDAADHVEITERLIGAVEIVAAYVLVFLFAVGVFDLGLTIGDLILSGAITDTAEVVGLVDTVLLLFIVVEIYRTVVAYTREESVLRIVIVTAVIAVARRIIVYKPTDYASPDATLFTAVGLAVLIAALVGSLHVLRSAEDDGYLF